MVNKYGGQCLAGSPTFCIMPWVHFHVGNQGTVRSCCIANIPYGNVNKEKIDGIWNGKQIREFRSKLMSEIPDKRCRVCYDREKGGAVSYRQETLQKYGHVLDYVMDKTTPDGTVQSPPIYFDIRFSNQCNFRCRTCWHGASSKWYKEAKILGNNIGGSALITNIDDIDGFLGQIGNCIDGVEEIYIAGGEPLVMKEHLLLLEFLAKHNKFDIHLRYNSNFSNLNFENTDLLQLWKHFHKIDYMASLDGMGKVGEYIRKDMGWETIMMNHQKLKGHAPHVHFMVSPTVSILNIWHLPEFYDFLISHAWIGPDDWYINILDRPFYYNIKALPPSMKSDISLFYLRLVEKGYGMEWCKMITDYMNSEDLHQYWEEFVTKNGALDNLRNESWEKTFALQKKGTLPN